MDKNPMRSSIVVGIIQIITLLSFFVQCYVYNDSNNIWADEEDKNTPFLLMFIFIIAIVLLVVCIFKVVKRGNVSQKPDYAKIKKHYVYNCLESAVEIVILLILSKEFVWNFLAESTSMDFFEAAYLSGVYEILKWHGLVYSVCELVDSAIVISRINERLANPTTTYEPQSFSDETNINSVVRINGKAWRCEKCNNLISTYPCVYCGQKAKKQ